jgi:hypothetical protein
MCGQNRSDGVVTGKMVRIIANGIKEEDGNKYFNSLVLPVGVY